jgi:RNA polymerase sigma factor (sigma-70 family)
MVGNELLAWLRRIPPPPAAITDGALHDRFRLHGDRDSLGQLVQRHADHIWTVCRKTATTVADAEDAFQATVLALIRSGHTIRDRASFAGWLYRVARHAAKATAVRPTSRIDSDIPDRHAKDDRGLFDAIDRLPEHERIPVLLCDWAGYTRDEAASILGCPIGTVNGRLSRGRERLRQVLTDRTVVTVGLLTVPTTLTATALATTSISPQLEFLVTGATTAMSTTTKSSAIALATLAVVGFGAAIAFGPAGQTPKRETAIAAKPRPASSVMIGKHEMNVLFPEMLDGGFQKLFETVPGDWGKLEFGNEVIPRERGMEFLTRERLTNYREAIVAMVKVINSGTWDTQFLDSLTIQLLEPVAWNLSDAQRLNMMVCTVRMFYYLENVVYQRVFIAQNLRSHVYQTTRIRRITAELALDAALKGRPLPNDK